MDDRKNNPGAAEQSERERLAEIAELELLSDEVGAILDDVVREASERLDLPIAMVNIVLDDAQFFAAHHGLSGWLSEVGGTPIEWSFCANAVRSGEPFVVDDATTHPLVKDIPLVEHDGIRCYAGIPLITSRGFPVGTLCVIGPAEHRFGEDDLSTLRELADEAMRRIEARRKGN